MRNLYFFYQALSGRHMPAATEMGGLRGDRTRTEEHLREERFKGSYTPLGAILNPCTTTADLQNLIAVFEAWLSTVPDSETGLRHSLEWVLGELKNEVIP